MLGEKIQKFRKMQKMSQEELGEVMGVTRQTISNWESGESAPNIMEAKKLANLLSLSLDELTDNDTDNVLIKKLDKIKNISNFNLGISLMHFVVFIGLIILGICLVINYYKVDTVGKSVEINCKLNDSIYNYKLNIDVKSDKIISLETNDYDLKSSFKYDKNDSYEDVIASIKDEVTKKGGNCNKID